ncbi:uncharacterized protein LOC135378140 [Ornithodoros turicata]|uniref:uncharacterized protein LOC135378140 n=1 Tax=Ornithodoros turicata TaxID=34597 RepID=UPI003139774D
MHMQVIEINVAVLADDSNDSMSTEQACVFFFQNPDFKTLENLQLALRTNGVDGDMMRQQCILKCRELIFSECQIIASPILQLPFGIRVILSDAHFESAEFQNRLSNLSLHISSRGLVQPNDFQTCLTYTSLARLAPSWNQVGQHLCQGKSFLISSGWLSTIRMEVVVTKCETEVSLTGGGIKLHHMSLSHIWNGEVISGELLEMLRTSEVQIEPLPCFVLPSMKQGHIMSVSFKTFDNRMFPGFESMHRFWKNMYGYSIPKEAGPTMIYVKVMFLAFPSKYYTYPILCVRPYQPLVHPRVNHLPIVASFLHDLEVCWKQIFGRSLSLLLRKPAFPTPQITWTAARVLEYNGNQQVGWTKKPNQVKVPYRALTSAQLSLCSPEKILALRAQDDACRQKRQSTTEAAVISKSALRFDAPASVPPAVKTPYAGPTLAYHVEDKPHFHTHESTRGAMTTGESKVVPKFGLPTRKMPVLKATHAGPTVTRNVQDKSGFLMKESTTGTTATSKLVPKFGIPTCKLPVIQAHRVLDQLYCRANEGTARPTEKVTHKVSPKYGASTNKPPSMKSHTFSNNLTQAEGKFVLPTAPKAQKIAPTFDSKLQRKEPKKEDQTKAHKSNFNSHASDIGARGAPSGILKMITMKKAKTLQQTVSDADVEAMIRQNKVHKINAATLHLWLRQKGIPCKCKEKKADLIAKAVKLVRPES